MIVSDFHIVLNEKCKKKIGANLKEERTCTFCWSRCKQKNTFPTMFLTSFFKTFGAPGTLGAIFLSFGCPGAPFGLSGRPWASSATKKLQILQLWASLCRQGTRRRPPEKPTVTKRMATGLLGPSQKEPQSEKVKFSRSHIF